MLPESNIPACVPSAPVDGGAPIALDPVVGAPEAPAPVLRVADLLQQSRDANHARIRESRRKSYIEAEAQSRKALALRELAHSLDPAHNDAAWQADTVPHAAICDFLRAYPSIP